MATVTGGLIFVLTLVTILVRPYRIPEAVAAAVGGMLMVLVGIVPLSEIMNEPNVAHWADEIHALLKAHDIKIISFVPDGGHKRLIELCQNDATLQTVTLTTEEEGIALAAGAFLGGTRAALLMQSSGVGNCINLLSLPRVCNMPFLTLVTMRGEWGEFNPWQVPMGQSTSHVLEASGVIVYRVDDAGKVAPTVQAAIQIAFSSRQRVAVLLSQKLIGAKNFARGDK
ncbi:MAG TPA: phosphonopyruvate decarboxylase [Anaerolineae bacterium]|nr:phosphonopyruvate decarboxylase [Anaerolineae bacterium]